MLIALFRTTPLFALFILLANLLPTSMCKRFRVHFASNLQGFVGNGDGHCLSTSRSVVQIDIYLVYSFKIAGYPNSTQTYSAFLFCLPSNFDLLILFEVVNTLSGM